MGRAIQPVDSEGQMARPYPHDRCGNEKSHWSGFHLGAVRIAGGQVRTAISPNDSKQVLRVSPWPSATTFRRV